MKHTFWKDNRNDQEYQLTEDELKKKYKAYLEHKGIDWVQYYGHQTIHAFVGDKEGLGSVTDAEVYEALESVLMETRHQFYKQYKESL